MCTVYYGNTPYHVFSYLFHLSFLILAVNAEQTHYGLMALIMQLQHIFKRYRFDVREHLKFGETNYLVVAFESPVKYAKRQFEHHKRNRYIVPVESLPDYMHAYNHGCFIR